MKNISFAICGFGHIGKRHAEMVHRHEYGQLAAIIDSDEEKCKQAKEKYPEANVYNKIELYIQDQKCDVGIIATPNYLHIPQADLFLRENHHVVIEKPMGIRFSDCVALNKNHHDKHIFCVMQNRYSPPAKLLKSMLEKGVLGNIYIVQIQCFWNRDERYYQPGNWRGSLEKDGGVLYTQFSHFIDMMYWLFGDIRNIKTRLYNHNHQSCTEFDDSGVATFDLEKGGSGSLHFSTSIYDTNFESSITIIAEKGTIKIGGQYMDEVSYCHVQDFVLPPLEKTKEANDYGLYKGSANNHDQVIRNVIATLNGIEKPHTSAQEGAKVVEIIERIYQAV